jgi:hypothetical protein
VTAGELRQLVELVLAMREPRCTCGHVLTQHSRRRLRCFGAHTCGCEGWTAAPRE